MRVSIAQDALDDQQAWPHLDRVFGFFIEEQHYLEINDLDLLIDSNWISTEPTSRTSRQIIEELKKFVMKTEYEPLAAHSHSTRIQITTVKVKEFDILPNEAFQILKQPAYVVLEDSVSDGAFFRTMIQAFDRSMLSAALDEGWLKLENGGGFNNFKRRHDELSASNAKPLRLIFIADSDRLALNHVSDTLKWLKKFVDESGATCVVLEKRKIENYLPTDLIPNGRNRRTSKRALTQLNQEQRDYYEMKQGFDRVNGRAEIPPEQTVLYQHVPQRILDALCGGFGDQVWTVFRDRQKDFDADSMRMICPKTPCELEVLLDAVEATL